MVSLAGREFEEQDMEPDDRVELECRINCFSTKLETRLR
jgi:hypothetical protein